MKKAEYIEKYGQEAWDKKAEKTRVWKEQHKEYNKEYQRTYKKTNLKKDEYIEKYGQSAWDNKLERSKNWKRNNREQHIKSVREWQNNNRGKTNSYKKKWKDNNRADVRAQSILDAYRRADLNEGRGECTITKNWIKKCIFTSSCVYCGDSDWEHLGCDRIDNNLPHTQENCVCACGICNVERGDRWSVSEFVEYRKTHPRELNTKKIPKLVKENGAIKKRELPTF